MQSRASSGRSRFEVGDVVEASANVAAVESKRGMTFVTLDLAATNQSGHTVCRGRSLLLLRGAGR